MPIIRVWEVGVKGVKFFKKSPNGNKTVTFMSIIIPMVFLKFAVKIW